MKHALLLAVRLLLMLVGVFAISVGCRQILDLDERRPHPLEVLTHLSLGLCAWTLSCVLAPRSPHAHCPSAPHVLSPPDEQDGRTHPGRGPDRL